MKMENRSDWFEATNLSAQKVSLLGYYLSDDLEDLRQWSFRMFPFHPIQSDDLCLW